MSAAVGLLAHLGDTGYLAFCSVCTFEHLLPFMRY